jgi:hypothetical protein
MYLQTVFKISFFFSTSLLKSLAPVHCTLFHDTRIVTHVITDQKRRD